MLRADFANLVRRCLSKDAGGPAGFGPGESWKSFVRCGCIGFSRVVGTTQA